MTSRRGTPLGGRVLGVDFGSKRIGLALSDPSRVVASPHEVITRGKDPESDYREIVAHAREAEATTIVVGLPLSLSGKDGPAARGVRDEVERLREVVGETMGSEVEILLHDERFTTVVAERSLNEARMNRDARKLVVDKVAAAVMLQSWLDGA